MVLLIAFPFFHIAKTRLTFIGGAKFGHLSRDGLTRLPSISCNASTVYSCLVPWQQKNGRAPTPSFIDYISPPSFVACGLVDFDIFIYFLWLPFSLWMLHKYPEFLSSVTTASGSARCSSSTFGRPLLKQRASQAGEWMGQGGSGRKEIEAEANQLLRNWGILYSTSGYLWKKSVSHYAIPSTLW